ncbi:hypothetical protein J5N97_022633 [Dioscorea zingiberensis]|uniref:Uncharacterized protein n=1 Tax=Dioscorea zingiberensis TaxID=325984 RepID=A0A9D5CAH1_9LILI|nr:hypothetical protein J5N97_022633 [Dioscorea zingiberensis]
MRIWEVDDEIKILKAIIAFYSDKGPEFPSNTVSSADLDAIHSLLKKSLGLEFTKGQLGAKIRGLRRKFRTNASQCKNNTDPKFSIPQRQEIFELSKQIWRPDNPNPNEAPKSSGKSVKSKGKSALKVLKDQEEEGDPRYELMWRAVAQAGHGDISLSLLKRGLKLVDPEKARLLERRFFKLELARMRHRLQWLDKNKEAIQLVIDSLAKSVCWFMSIGFNLQPSVQMCFCGGILRALKGLSFVVPGTRVLYLEAASGITVSHVSDIVGPVNVPQTDQANCIDSTVPVEAIFAQEVTKLHAEQFKPSEKVTLEPFGYLSCSWFQDQPRGSDLPERNQKIMSCARSTCLICRLWAGSLMQKIVLNHFCTRPVKAGDWFLFVIEAPFSCNGRGFNTDRMFNQKGKLVMSLAQEALLREMEAPSSCNGRGFSTGRMFNRKGEVSE